MMLNNKRAVSPLAATIILVLFSLLLGTITMNLGKSYIEGIAKVEQKTEGKVMQKYIDDSLYQCSKVDPETEECVAWVLVK